MKKRGWIFALACIALVLTALWLRIRNKRGTIKPEVSVANIVIKNIDGDYMYVIALVRIYNPLPLTLKADSMQYDLYLNETKVVSEAYNKRLEIPERHETIVALPLKLNVKGIVEELSKMKDTNADSAHYTIVGGFHMNIPVAGERSFNFKISKWLPSFQVPSVSVEDLDLKKLNLKQSVFEATLSVYNPNSYRLQLADFGIQILIDDAINVVGSVEGLTTLEARQTQIVPVKLRFKDQNIIKATWLSLFRKESTPTSIRITSILVSKSPIIDSTRVNIHTSGTLKDLRHAYDAAREAAKPRKK